MPSDANGVYSLPDGYLAVTGAPIQASQHNPPLEDLGNAMTGRLPRSGVAAMTGPLRVPDGTVDTPTIAFASDPSAGFYLSGGKIIPTKPMTGILPIGLGPLPWSRLTAPTGWVFCYGQILSRVTYADLWLVAQAEIAAGNTMYNNGDGSTTFGILDMRGCVFATYDALGGVGAGRLTGAFGAFIGAQTHQITANEMYPHTHSGTTGGMNAGNPHTHTYQRGFGSTAGPGGLGGLFQANVQDATGAADINHGHDFVTNGGNGVNGAAHNNVQPTRIGGAILYAGA